MEEYPNPADKQVTKTILKQMDNTFYKIDSKDEIIGFFCYIKYKNEKISVIIINKYLRNDYIKDSILLNDKNINLKEILYKNHENNITIIKIENKKTINDKFIEIDDRLYGNEYEMNYNNESIYILQYININYILVSYGAINKINKSQIKYIGNINKNTKYSLIFNLSNNKLIGFHTNNSNYYNNGILFKSIINETIYEYNENKHYCYKNNNNEIIITIKIDKKDTNKDIYFLDNYENKDEEGNKYNYHGNLKELNKLNADLYINNYKTEYKKYFRPEKEGEYNFKLKFKNNLNDCSYMFAGCKNIININFLSFSIKNIISMKYMFYECENLKHINFFSFNTKNVINMENMFYNCKSLINIDLSSFDTNKVINMNGMFLGCYLLNELQDITKWNTENVTNMSDMFSYCSSLKKLDISKWNTKNVNNMSGMFSGCNSLKALSDISRWDTKNVNNLSGMFCWCSSLKQLPDISKWNTSNVNNMSSLFYGCSSLKQLPDISIWDTKNVNNMSSLFCGCSSLIKLPDIFKWNIKNIVDKEYIFDGCEKKIIPKKFKK